AQVPPRRPPHRAAAAALQRAVLRALRGTGPAAFPCRDVAGDDAGQRLRDGGARRLQPGALPCAPQVSLPAAELPVLPGGVPAGLRGAGGRARPGGVSATRVDALLAAGTRRLPGAEARFEAELLLGHALGRDRAWLFAHARDTVGDQAAARFGALCDRRARGEPMAYIVGRRGFWTLDLAVTPDTLVPRPETELLVEAALARLPVDRPLTIADLGTGSGAIA